MFTIAVGKRAGSRIWKNQQINWDDFVKRLTEYTRTKETLKEFLQCSKEDQTAIKDVGGYVGGYLRNGRRSLLNVVYRQILTLDIDFATIDFWENFTLWYDFAAVLHSTHKHREEVPRLRLIIPLDREATSAEYEAVGRYIAGSLGIELFDNTTFDPNRLMFWPSVPVDQDYYFKEQKGSFLSVDEVLSYYPDWKDVSLWPTSKKLRDLVNGQLVKQEDPELKKGIIGAFCRTYTIQEAIHEYLQDEYQETLSGRFTYLKGSTSGGLIIYDDKFAYSHHGTDPTSGKLCNAFDLVRIHKFGDTKESKKQTEELLIADPQVKHTLAKERFESANAAFENVDLVIDWAKDLEVDAKGKYLSTATNINLILQNDPNLKGKFKYNEFDNKIYLNSKVPWRQIQKCETVRDVDYSGVRNYIETVYGITGNLKIDDSLAIEIEKNKFHPVKEYLSSLSWDGVKRIDKLLVEYFGCEDNLYTRESIRKTLVGAVSRIFEPGCKFDLVLVLAGYKEGTGKSTFIRKLGKDWFSDTFTTVHGKESFEQIQGVWLMEIAELAGFRKSDIESVKHYITKQSDAFRLAFKRTTETFPRQVIFVGTTNDRNFLKSNGNNRRFMPVDVREEKATKNSLTNALDKEVDQIWAEAVFLYQMGETLYLSAEANRIANKERADHSEHDERSGLIESYLERKLPKDWDQMDFYERRLFINNDKAEGEIERQIVCIAEIWCECLQKNREDMDKYKTRDINEIMRSLPGWEIVNSTKNFKIYGKQKFYKRCNI